LKTENKLPSTLFYNGRIYNHPKKSAILCYGDKITAIGNRSDFNAKKKVDLNGGVVYPGFIDSHLHLLGTGQALENINLNGIRSPQDVIPVLKKHIQSIHKSNSWILGRGWDQNLWEGQAYPDKLILDEAAPNIPVAFQRVDGHTLWVNSKAMELAGISKNTPSPSGGVIVKNKEGVPAGVLVDNAMSLVLDIIPDPSKPEIERLINKAASHLNSFGLTSIHDPGTTPDTISVLINNESRSTLGVYAMLNYDESEIAPFLNKAHLISYPSITVRAVKIYLDGALGSRGAALLEPYSDEPENDGLILEAIEKVKIDIKRFNQLGYQTAIHCIGDRANRIALDLYEEVGIKECRNRVEHAQMVHHKDIHRFSKLSVLPCMQPVHCTSDMGWLHLRVGKDRLCEAYPWNSLVKAGSIIPGGSDAPIESPDPLRGIYAAITRKNEEGYPASGWQGHETVSMDNAIKMYTEWAAYAGFEENVKGQIKEGFNADLTVLDRDLLRIHPSETLETKVKMTIVNGNVVYSA